MRLVSWSTRTATLTITFFVGVAAGQAFPVLWKSFLVNIGSATYQDATYKCDRAMRDHLIAKQSVYFSTSTQNVQALEAAEIGLIVCQDYDLLRKRLILFGLGENELSIMALKAIEAKANDLQEVVDLHEIRY